jgi:CRISPR/Cas system CSM-associated protein Csm2 small subunit|tara:strand:- start:410 stop:994 length:585 start_codon:yes stop_codon:yes gene_type:complete
MAREQIQVIVPTDWKDITIAEYQRYLQLAKTRRKTKDDEIIAMFCKVDKDLIKKVKLKDKKVLVDKINKFVNSKNETSLEKRIKFKGKKYGFIPNLSKITTGEFVDIEEYGKDININLHRIMSVLYREVDRESGKYYSVKPYDPDELEIDKFKDLPMSTTLSAIDFFFLLGKNLLVDLNNYSTEVMKMSQAKKH